MEKKTISEWKQLFSTNNISKEMLTFLEKDERKGVQLLLKQYYKQQLTNKKLKQQFEQMTSMEKDGYRQGYQYIAGIDEVGRGPLAGPVVAAAVILPSNFKLLGLNDSKQLSEAKENEFFEIIKENAVSYGIALATNEEIDQINIYEATKLAMLRAVHQLYPKPDLVLIDAVNLEQLTCPSHVVTKGDQRSISIAAASILAKVTRDSLMKRIHNEYPAYHFEANMGYCKYHHLEALLQYGPTPYHRKSFAPVRDQAK